MKATDVDAAELAVIADILVAGTTDLGNPKAWQMLDELSLSPEDFNGGRYSTRGSIWAAFLALRQKKVAIDPITTANSLAEEPARKLIIELSRKAVTAAFAHDHADIVKDASTRRTLRSKAADIIDLSEDKGVPLEEVLGRAQASILTLGRDQNKYLSHISAIVPRMRESIGKGLMEGPGSGLVDWDNLTGGFPPGKMSIIGGRPAQGKSSLAAQVARQLALKGHGVIMFHLEDSAVQVVQRMVQGMAGVSRGGLLSGKLTEEENQKINHALSLLSTAPLYIDESKNLTVPQMMSRARQIAAETPIAMVIVDYLQLLIRGSNDRVGELATISRMLAVASGPDDLNCHILAVSQLSRALETRQNKRPQLHDLRESGSLEQDARMVTFLYRPKMATGTISVAQQRQYVDGTEPCELIVAKRNDGKTGTAHVAFHGPTVSFRCVTKGQENGQQAPPWSESAETED